MSEYDPVLSSSADESDDLDRARDLFAAASRPYLESPWPWLTWAVLLPVAALLSPPALAHFGPTGALGLWSGVIILGGAIETGAIRRGRRPGSSLASWVLRAQANLSLVAVMLSAVLLWRGQAEALPGLWLLLLGHSFYGLGGLASPALRRSGLLYQLGGAVALWPHGHALEVFAATTAAGNVALALAAWRPRPG